MITDAAIASHPLVLRALKEMTSVRSLCLGFRYTGIQAGERKLVRSMPQDTFHPRVTMVEPRSLDNFEIHDVFVGWTACERQLRNRDLHPEKRFELELPTVRITESVTWDVTNKSSHLSAFQAGMFGEVVRDLDEAPFHARHRPHPYKSIAVLRPEAIEIRSGANQPVTAEADRHGLQLLGVVCLKDAGDFEIADLKVGAISQLCSSDPMPGSCFVLNAFTPIYGDSVKKGQAVTLSVNNISSSVRSTAGLRIVCAAMELS